MTRISTTQKPPSDRGWKTDLDVEPFLLVVILVLARSAATACWLIFGTYYGSRFTLIRVVFWDWWIGLLPVPATDPPTHCSREHVYLTLEEEVVDTKAKRGARDAFRRCCTLQGEACEHVVAGDSVDASSFPTSRPHHTCLYLSPCGGFIA